jgi:putative oxidoreductase
MSPQDDDAAPGPGLTLLVDERRTAIDGFTRLLVRVPVILVFLLVGITKFSNDPHGEWVRVFETIGFGQWFRYFTGAMQVSGALLLLARPTRALGALMLGATMIGAAIVDIFVMRSPGYSLAPLVLLGAVVATWFGGRE